MSEETEERDDSDDEDLDIVYGNQFEVAQKVIEHFEDEIKRIISLRLSPDIINERGSAIEDAVACIISSYVQNQDSIKENVLDFLFHHLDEKLVILSDQIGKLNGEAVNSNWRSRYGIRVSIPSWDEVVFFRAVQAVREEHEKKLKSSKKKKK